MWSKGVCVGWGATCGRHTSVGERDDARCKTRLDFGVEGLTPEVCKLRLKRWLIAGIDVDDASDTARHEHLHLRARSFTEGLNAAECDAVLVAAGLGPP